MKKIAFGVISDILSYMKSFDLGKYFELDETEIKKRCHEKYKGRLFKVKRDNISRDVWSNLEDYDQEYYKANYRWRTDGCCKQQEKKKLLTNGTSHITIYLNLSMNAVRVSDAGQQGAS